MHTVTRLIRGATLVGLTISGVIMNVVMLLLVANVALRFFGIQILGLYEILTALTVVLLGLSLADAQREKQHVAIDLLTAKLPQRMQDALGVVTTLIAVAVFTVIAIALTRYAGFQITAATASELLRIPSWPTLSLLIGGIVLLVLTLLIDASRRARSAFPGIKRLEETW